MKIIDLTGHYCEFILKKDDVKGYKNHIRLFLIIILPFGLKKNTGIDL
jgi:hypothetical protein